MLACLAYGDEQGRQAHPPDEAVYATEVSTAVPANGGPPAAKTLLTTTQVPGVALLSVADTSTASAAFAGVETVNSGKFPEASEDWLTAPLVVSERVAVTAEATSVAASSSVLEYETVRVITAPGA